MLFGKQLGELRLEALDVPERPVDAREADVGDLVEAP